MWDWYERRLGALAHFFSQGDRCELFIEVFLEKTPYEQYTRYFENDLCPNFQPQRWAALTNAFQWLRVRRDLLITVWQVGALKRNMKKKTGGEEQQAGEGQQNAAGSVNDAGATAAAAGGTEAIEDPKEYVHLDLELMDRSVMDPGFWFYGDMHLELGRMPGGLVRWFSSYCPCHGFIRRGSGSKEDRQNTRASGLDSSNRQKSSGYEKTHRDLIRRQLGTLATEYEKTDPPMCVMCGKVAPEMAAGEHLTMLRDLGRDSRARLLNLAVSFGRRGKTGEQLYAHFPDAYAVLARLAPDASDAVLRDFDLGVDHLDVVVVNKTVYATQTPFSLSVFALTSEERALTFMDDIFYAFDSAPSHEGFDRVTRLWLERGYPGGFRQDLEEWKEHFPGKQLKDYPRLRTAVASRRFIQVDESVAETGHGKMKKRTAMRACEGKMQSMAIRQGEVLKRLDSKCERDADLKSTLVRLMDISRSPLECIKALNIESHPTIAAAVTKYYGTRTKTSTPYALLSTISQVLYRNDRPSKYKDNSKAKEENTKLTKRMKDTTVSRSHLTLLYIVYQ
jgi:hypothetical protein